MFLDIKRKSSNQNANFGMKHQAANLQKNSNRNPNILNEYSNQISRRCFPIPNKSKEKKIINCWVIGSFILKKLNKLQWWHNQFKWIFRMARRKIEIKWEQYIGICNELYGNEISNPKISCKHFCCSNFSQVNVMNFWTLHPWNQSKISGFEQYLIEFQF